MWGGKTHHHHTPKTPTLTRYQMAMQRHEKCGAYCILFFCPRRRTDSGNRQGLFPFFYYTGGALSMSFAKFKRLSTMVIVNSLIILSAVVDKGLSRFSPRRRQKVVAHHLLLLQSLSISVCRRLSQDQDSLQPLKQFYGLQRG